MHPKVTIEIPQEAYDDLLILSDTLGFSPEMAVHYAVRLVNACIREGLLTDVPSRAWPQEANMQTYTNTGTQGKVIDFPSEQAHKSKE